MIKTGIIGQKHIFDVLNNQIEREKLSNGYLIKGQKGFGKKELAYDFANAILCKNKTGKCDCVSCKKFKTNNHPNLKMIKTDEKQIKVEQITEILKQIKRAPYEDGYYVVIIEDAEKMNASSQNKLLKSLEEPQNTIFLLTTNNNSLLDTIVSRCLIFEPKPVNSEEIRSLLKEKFSNKEDAQIDLSVNYSMGNIGKAIKLIADEEFLSIRERVINDLLRLQKEANLPFVLAREYKEYSHDKILDIFNIIKLFIRDCAVYKKTKSISSLINKDFADEIINMETDNPVNKLRYIEEMSSYLQTNVNKEMLIQNLYIELINI